MTATRLVRKALALPLACAAGVPQVRSGELVRVGAYLFLPFVDRSGGLTADLVQASKVFLKGDGELYVARSQPGRPAGAKSTLKHCKTNPFWA